MRSIRLISVRLNAEFGQNDNLRHTNGDTFCHLICLLAQSRSDCTIVARPAKPKLFNMNEFGPFSCNTVNTSVKRRKARPFRVGL